MKTTSVTVLVVLIFPQTLSRQQTIDQPTFFRNFQMSKPGCMPVLTETKALFHAIVQIVVLAGFHCYALNGQHRNAQSVPICPIQRQAEKSELEVGISRWLGENQTQRTCRENHTERIYDRVP